MNSIQIKRGHPTALLLGVMFAWVALRGFLDLKEFLSESSRKVWDYLDLGFTFLVLCVVGVALARRLFVRWEREQR